MLYITILLIILKNLFYYLLLEKKFNKVLFTIIAFIIFIVSMFLILFLINHENDDRALIAVIANFDFLLIFFSFVAMIQMKVGDFFAQRANVTNPLRFFGDIRINLKYFYITITIIQVLFIILFWDKLT